MSALVSVLLPVCNGETTVKEAIHSLQMQTLEEFEIVVIDDGSMDETPDILRQLEREDSRIRNIRTAHRGLVPALNAGLEEARGEYIARMDADDISLPPRLELQKDYLDRHSQVGLVACRVIFGGDRRSCGGYAHHVEWVNSLVRSDEISLNRFVESPLAHPSVMFRRRLVEQFGGYRQGDFPEDYELWLRWLERGVQMEKLEEELLRWDDRPGRLSRTNKRYAVDRFYQIKSGYLFRWLRSFNPLHPDVWLIGAGKTSRRRARLLEKFGVRVTGYVDIDPRKIGHRIQGRPVVDRNQIPPPGTCFFLSYVGSRGAREDIQAFLESRGHQLGRDFLLAA